MPTTSIESAQESTIEQPARPAEFPKVDFLVVGNQMFSVAPVNLPLGDVLNEVKQAYEDEYQARVREITDEQYEDSRAEWDRQLSHINRVRNARAVTIPQELQGAPVMYWNGAVCALRIIRYNPNECTGAAGDLKNRTGLYARRSNSEAHYWKKKEGYGKVFTAVNTMPSDAKVIIKIKQDLVDVPAVFAYDNRNIYTPLTRYFHTLNDARKLCTGGHTAAAFWNANDFAQEVNRVNYFSLAASEINIPVHGVMRIVQPHEILRDEYVVDVRREEGTWRA